jgi:tRNA(fMet)-specific endonuclease VapC
MKIKGYLLDTNILFAIIKDPQGRAAQQIRIIGNDKIFTSIIVAAELQFGIREKDSSVLTQRVEDLLEAIQILDFKSPADRYYGEIRNYLQKKGTLIDPNDLLIAAHALAENLLVVTDNIREFERVPDLK